MTGQDFKLWRQRLGLTQAQAAEVLCLSIQAVKGYETGVRDPQDSTAKLCAFIERFGDIGPPPY